MIKVDEERVNISGKGIEMLTEFSAIVAALYEIMREKGISKEKAEETIYSATTVGIHFQETQGKEENSITEMVDEMIKKILKGEKDDESKME